MKNHPSPVDESPEWDPRRGSLASEETTQRGDEARRPPASESPLLGRAWELAELRSGLEDAASGRGRAFLLVGEPGIGKTRLADELSREAAAHGARAYWGRCWEAGSVQVYWPWIQVIRSLLRDRDLGSLLPDIGPGAPYVAELLPELRDLHPDLARVEGSPDPEQDPARLFDAIATLVAGASNRATLVLIFDDLHAADRPSLSMLRFLAHELRRLRVLVVGTYRELEGARRPETAEILGEVARAGTTIHLRGLAKPEVARMIQAASGSPAPEALVEQIHRATEGNPLFVSEVLGLLASERRLEAADASVGVALPTPEPMRQTIRRRIALVLSDEAKEVLHVAAALGLDFELGILRRVCRLPAERVLDALAEGTRGNILTEHPGATRYGFAHSVIRDTIYEDLPPTPRLKLHLRIGEALEERYGTSLDPHLSELSYHFSLAAPIAEPGKAVDYTVRAAERAARLFAHQEAVTRYELALQLFDLVEPPDEGRRCEVLLALGLAQNRAGDVDKAQETFLRAAESARARGAAEQLARAAVGYGSETFTTGAVNWPLVHLLEEALEALGDEDSVLRVDVATRLAFELYYTDARDQRVALSEEAVEMARRLGDPVALSYALETHAVAGAGPDNVKERLEVGTEIVRLAEEQGPTERSQTGHHWRLTALLEMGEIPAVDREMEVYVRLAEEFKRPAHLWYSAVLRATRALFAGWFEEADQLMRLALDTGEKGRGEEAVQYFTVQMFTLARALGRLDALGRMEATLADLSRRYPTLPAYRAALACVYVELERQPAARSELDMLAANEFADLPRNVGLLAALALLSEVCAALGDVPRAEALYGLLLPYADHNVVFDWSVACFGSASRYLGLLAATMGRYDDAVRHFEDALRFNSRMGARPYVAHTQRDYAGTLMLRDGEDDRSRAIVLLREAWASYRDLGMESHMKEALLLLEKLGEVPQAARPRPAHIVAASFEKQGEYWSIGYNGDEFRLKDSKGLQYIAELLRHPGGEFYILDLVAAIEGAGGQPSARPRRAGHAEPGLHPSSLGDAGELLDPQARAAYKRRLEDLREDVREAEEWGDPERAARAREEMDFLTRELAAAVGLGGRERKAASATERARINVTKAIKAAIRRAAEHSPALGHHLSTTIRTGTFCSYDPGPVAGVSWRL